MGEENEMLNPEGGADSAENAPTLNADAGAAGTHEAPAEADPSTPGGDAQAAPRALEPGQLQASSDPNGEVLDLDFILDIPLQVKVEVGRTRMMIQELLRLGKGSVVELNKLLGEPFEIFVNDKLVARGEVVVVNDRFGVRLLDIISPNERVKSLG